ncbi:MAG: hypothetical protein QXZ70_08375 [Candidatus Bathyarchaeia archaeon]
MSTKEFALRLLNWWASNKKDFPWRKTKDAFSILIAEILLRKTTAKQVARIYQNFMQKFPDPIALSEASIEELEELTRPLGIERKRAVLLKTLGTTIVQKYSGKVPLSKENLIDLPGVGQYSANAVLCFVLGEDVPLVDTNFIRVFQRVFGLKSRKPRPKDDPFIWRYATDAIPHGKAPAFNLAVIDFAHAICTPKNPKHETCPLRTMCEYYQAMSK